MKQLLLSEQERELIETLREWGDKVKDAYAIRIEWRDGAWDIRLKALDTKMGARGTGKTFAAAWDDMAPTRK